MLFICLFVCVKSSTSIGFPPFFIVFVFFFIFCSVPCNVCDVTVVRVVFVLLGKIPVRPPRGAQW